jgi:hypothetical protein
MALVIEDMQLLPRLAFKILPTVLCNTKYYTWSFKVSSPLSPALSDHLFITDT